MVELRQQVQWTDLILGISSPSPEITWDYIIHRALVKLFRLIRKVIVISYSTQGPVLSKYILAPVLINYLLWFNPYGAVSQEAKVEEKTPELNEEPPVEPLLVMDRLRRRGDEVGGPSTLRPPHELVLRQHSTAQHSTAQPAKTQLSG